MSDAPTWPKYRCTTPELAFETTINGRHATCTVTISPAIAPDNLHHLVDRAFRELAEKVGRDPLPPRLETSGTGARVARDSV